MWRIGNLDKRDGRRFARITRRVVSHAGHSPGQAIVEMAFGLPLLVLAFTIIVSAGQMIGYDVGLTNAAGAAAQAAAGASSPSTAAINAVNQEQGSSSWVACAGSGSPTPPCVSVSSSTQSTSGGASVSLETVTLHGSFSPTLNVFGIAIPMTVTASASVNS